MQKKDPVAAMKDELNALISVAVRDEAATELKRKRIKELMGVLALTEHKAPFGETAKLSAWTEYKCDVEKARAVLDAKTFANLFPAQDDSKTIAAWVASDTKNAKLAAEFRTGKQSTARLYLSAAK